MKFFKVLLICSIPFIPNTSSSQSYWEIGAFGGITNYLGDLSPVFLTMSETHPALGGFVRFNPHRFFAIRGGVTYGMISGDDSKHSDIDFRMRRNLSFKSTIFEVAITGELNLSGYMPINTDRRFSPYVFGGGAMFMFNPRALYQGQWVDLQPLGTEGQGTSAFPDREPYKLTQLAVVGGGGVKIALTEFWNLGLEIGFRKTFTDYLDDVSSTYVAQEDLVPENGALAYSLSNRSGEVRDDGVPVPYDEGTLRGDPHDKDWYIFAGITISRNLIKGGGGGPGCPSFK